MAKKGQKEKYGPGTVRGKTEYKKELVLGKTINAQERKRGRERKAIRIRKRSEKSRHFQGGLGEDGGKHRGEKERVLSTGRDSGGSFGSLERSMTRTSRRTDRDVSK